MDVLKSYFPTFPSDREDLLLKTLLVGDPEYMAALVTELTGCGDIATARRFLAECIVRGWVKP